MVWCWLLLRKPHSLALSLTASSVVSSFSLICLVSLSLGDSLAFQTSVLLRLLLGLDMYGGLDPLGVSSISKEGCGYLFGKHIRLRSFPVCWWSANVTAIPKGAPSPDRETTDQYQQPQFCLRCMRS